MENNIVKAFRQRLKRGGFSDIKIYNHFDGTYSVNFRYNGKYQRRTMTLIQMQNTPHLVWFD